MTSASNTNPSIAKLTKQIKELESKLENVSKEKDDLHNTFRSINLITKNANALYSISDFDIKCTFRYVSPSVTKIAGYEPEEMVGKSAFDFVHPKDKKSIVLPLMKTYLEYKAKKILKGDLKDKSETFYYRCKDKWGKWRHVETTSVLVGDKLIMVTADDDDKKEVENKLKQTQIDFNNLLTNLNDIYFRIDQLGIIRDINPIIEKIAGFKPKELLGKPVSNVFRTDNDFKQFINEIKTSGTLNNYDMILLRKDGSNIHVSANVYILRDNDGKQIGLEGILRDNTERKEAELNLQKSERNMAFLASSAFELINLNSMKDICQFIVQKLYEIIEEQGMVFVVDYDCDTELWEMQEWIGLKPFQKKLVGMLGFDISTLKGNFKSKYNLKVGKLTKLEDSLSELTRGIIPSKLNDPIKKLISLNDLYCIPFQKDGEIQGNITIITNYNTKPINSVLIEAFISQVSNYYEKLKIEEELEKSKDQYRDLVEKSDIAILVDDKNGNFTYFNDTFPKLYNYTADEIKKKSIKELVHPDDVKIVIGYHNKRMKGEKTISDYNFRAIKKDGSIMHLRVMANGVDENDKIIGTRSYIWDITDKVKSQDALRESEEKFSKSFKSSPYIVGISTLHEGKYVDVNDEFVKATGFSRKEIIGRTSLELGLWKTPQDRNFIKNSIESKGNVKGIELELISKNGKLSSILFSAEKISLNGEPHLIASGLDITDKKIAEAALVESENRFRLITDLTSDLAYSFKVHKDGSFTNLWSTGPIDKITGYLAGEITDMGGWDKIVVPEDMYIVEGQIKQLFKKQDSLVEYRVKRKDGEIIWVRDYSKPVLNSKTNKVEKIYGSIKEITEKKQAELEVQKLSIAIEQSPVTIVITDINGKIEYVNPYFEIQTGYSFKEAVGLNPNVLKSGIHEESLYKDLWDTILNGEIWDGELLNKKKNGDLYWESARISPIQDENGKISNFVAIKRDITDNKNLVDELTRNRKKYQDLYDNAPDMYFSVNQKGIVLSVNEFGAKYLGYKKEELVGNSVWIVVHQDDLKMVQSQITKIIDNRTPFSEIEFRKIRKDGTTLYVQERLQCIVGENNKCVELRINCRDVSENKKTQKRIIDYQRNLKTLSNALIVAEEKERKRLAISLHDSIGQLLAMTNIKISTLEKRLDKPIYETEINEIKKLVTKAIRESRSLTYELSPPILHELGLYAASKWYIDQLNNQHDIIIRIVGDEVRYNITEEIQILLYRAIRELLNNIIKHAETTSATLTLNKYTHHIKLTLLDEGKGFDVDKLRETSIKGKKFGLFSITERIEYLGGSFDINSVKGKGTKITIKVPI